MSDVSRHGSGGSARFTRARRRPRSEGTVAVVVVAAVMTLAGCSGPTDPEDVQGTVDSLVQESGSQKIGRVSVSKDWTQVTAQTSGGWQDWQTKNGKTSHDEGTAADVGYLEPTPVSSFPVDVVTDQYGKLTSACESGSAMVSVSALAGTGTWFGEGRCELDKGKNRVTWQSLGGTEVPLDLELGNGDGLEKILTLLIKVSPGGAPSRIGQQGGTWTLQTATPVKNGGGSCLVTSGYEQGAGLGPFGCEDSAQNSEKLDSKKVTAQRLAQDVTKAAAKAGVAQLSQGDEIIVDAMSGSRYLVQINGKRTVFSY